MVLARLLSSVVRRPADSLRRLKLAELDALLDVTTDRFGPTVDRLIKRFQRTRLTIDLDELPSERQPAGRATAEVTFPDVREPDYQQDLRRIVPMDRAEEFRMARRHEFLATLLQNVLERSGMPAAGAVELRKQPAAEVRRVALGLRLPRGVDRDWFVRMVEQFATLRRAYVEGALYIVLSTVNRYRGLGVDTQDLIQEGNASLFQAIDGFDWRRDVRFRTYAQFWVHQAVLKMLYNSSRTVRLPIWVQKLLGKIRRAQDEARRAGREITHGELAAKLGVPEEKIGWVLATRRYAVSIDAPRGEDEASTLAQSLADDAAPAVPDSVPVGDLRQALAEAMADLPDRERRILRRRYGLDGQEPETLGEIAADLGITAERVRQLQNAALGRIKRPQRLQQLQAFVE
jgi:RNA polymerase sigma factor (sigma-70 family)